MEKSLSRTLSYFLRHAPGEAGLHMNKQGFVKLDELVEALGSRGKGVSEKELREKIKTPGVERFEVVGEQVRALYGHSVEVDPGYESVEPPEILYHGTSRFAWDSIKKNGLQSQSRQYVHLTQTVQEAQRVGARHDKNPVILEITPPDLPDVNFYQAGPVILTEYVPPLWISLYQGEE